MSVPPLDRKLLAILAADVVGFSKAMEADEAGTIARLKASRTELVDPLIAQHHGRIVKLMGDGALVAFDSVVDAVVCAAEIQKAAAARNAGLPEPERLVFRMGINLGDVALVDGDVYGDGVNVAARLEQLADPGGVMVSGTAYDHLQGKLHWPLDFIGEQQVKNITRPVRAYRLRLDGRRARWTLRKTIPRWKRASAAAVIALLLAGAGTWWFLQPVPLSANPSVAVLPFDNYGGDEATGRLADGLTQDIITDLSRISDIDVIARNSTEAYKGKSADVRQIGRELNVRYVLEGSIQRQGGRIRATAQLIDAQTGAHIWSEQWDRPVEDVFAVQTEIADHILGQFEISAGPIRSADLGVARRKRPESLTAYDLNLLGVEKQWSPTAGGAAESIQILKQAVAADPGYARAWINLAWAHDMAAAFIGRTNSEASNRAAVEAAERAVALDPNDAEAHAVLGHLLGFRGEFDRAKAQFDLALRLNPGSAGILTYYLRWASTFGEPERGAAMADRAIRLNPNYQPWVSNFLRPAYFMAGRYADALKAMERLMPDNYNKSAWVQRAASFAVLGQKAEAEATVKEALRRYPDLTIESFANEPGYNDAERQRHIETMRLAGFAPCARPEALAKLAKPLRLPECEGKELKSLVQP